jgi:ABC-2 type transport system permease protein
MNTHTLGEPRFAPTLSHTLQAVTLVNPLRYIMVIVKGIFLKQMPGGIVFENLWAMLAIAVITLSFATLFFRRRLA